MPGYIVYWPLDHIKTLQKAQDNGPIKVVYGSIHTRMPTIVSIKEGDVVFPVTLMNKQLCAMARLPVEHRERAFDYCLRELGCPCGALTPEDEDEENPRPQFSYQDTWTPTKPHLAHQVPFNCCAEWAVWGERGTGIRPRPLPAEAIPALRFGFPKSKERPLRLDSKGNVLTMSLGSTRRMSAETLAIFEALFADEC